MRAHDILCGVDLLTARPDVDAHSIRAFARGVKGVWLLLAAASCRKIGKVWLDRSPYSLRVALQNSMAADLVKAMGSRPVVWTDRTNWMRRVVALGPGFRYRYVLGDATDLADAQDDAYIRELLSSTEEALRETVVRNLPRVSAPPKPGAEQVSLQSHLRTKRRRNLPA